MDNNLALHEAIAKADMENLIRLLHHPDVDINYKDNKGDTPLLASIKKESGSTMALSLIRAGCDINCRDRRGYTPLHKAVEHNFTDVARELILHGAYVEEQVKSCEDDTPLSMAIINGNLEAVCLFLHYQVDVAIRLDTRATHRREAFISNPSDNISKVLLDYFHEISDAGCFREAAFSLAVRNKNALAMHLLKRRASVNSLDNWNNTPLHFGMHHVNDKQLFKLIFSENDYKRLFGTFLKGYICRWRFSNSDWLECLYLILNCPVASELIKQYEHSIAYDHHDFLWILMAQFELRNIERKDRISIINICLNLGIKVKADDLQYTHMLYGSNGEFEAVVHVGDLSYNDYKDQMRLLFKEPFKSAIPIFICETLRDFWGPTRKLELCHFGFFSMSPETRIQHLHWIKSYNRDILNVTLEKLNKIPQFPSLMELAREPAQRFIEERFNIIKANQFYDVVRSLQLPQFVKDVILFKQPLY